LPRWGISLLQERVQFLRIVCVLHGDFPIQTPTSALRLHRGVHGTGTKLPAVLGAKERQCEGAGCLSPEDLLKYGPVWKNLEVNEKMTTKMTDNDATMTRSGYDRLSAELIELRTERRAEIARQLEEARSFGDLSENAEYATAKEEQSKLEARILQLEVQLGKAKILDEEKLDTKKVSLGLTVTLKEMTPPFNTFTYTIVGSEETDPKTHSISQKSPVGQAILGKSVGDEVYVKIHKGIRHLQVTQIALTDKK
jgi:transcription elongation factor GreA